MNRPTLRELARFTGMDFYGWHFPSGRPVFATSRGDSVWLRGPRAGQPSSVTGQVITRYATPRNLANLPHDGEPLYTTYEDLQQGKCLRSQIEKLEDADLDCVDVRVAARESERALELVQSNRELIAEVERHTGSKFYGCIPSLATLVFTSEKAAERSYVREVRSALKDLGLPFGWGKVGQSTPSAMFFSAGFLKGESMIVPVGASPRVEDEKPYIGLGTEGQLMSPPKPEVKPPLPALPLLGMKKGRPYLDLSRLSEDRQIRKKQFSSFKGFKKQVEQQFGWTPAFRPLAQALRNAMKADLGLWPLDPHLKEIEGAFAALCQDLCKHQEEKWPCTRPN